jgi:hypothetical protein
MKEIAAFQNLEAGSDLWEQAFGRGFEHHLGAEKLGTLNRFFQRRHLSAHKDGIDDAAYVENCGDTYNEASQRIVVKEDEVRRCLVLVGELAGALEPDVAAEV